MMLLTACGTADFDFAANQIVCPSIVDYDISLQSQAAIELSGLNSESVLRRMMNDYGILRQKIRLCHAAEN